MNNDFRTSLGHNQSSAAWLDMQFTVFRGEWLQLIDKAGFREGQHILDAGCGSGNCLLPLTRKVKKNGTVTAVDLAPENVAVARERSTQANVTTPIIVCQGSVADLSFPSAVFDGIWCSGVMLYLNDEQLAETLSSFYRVLRPGGIVAILDIDPTLTALHPLDPIALWRVMAGEGMAMGTGDPRSSGMRLRRLASQLKELGFDSVTQQTFIFERAQPLGEHARTYLGHCIAMIAQQGLRIAADPDEKAFWRLHQDSWNPGHIMNDPEFYYREGYLMVVGRKRMNG